MGTNGQSSVKVKAKYAKVYCYGRNTRGKEGGRERERRTILLKYEYLMTF